MLDISDPRVRQLLLDAFGSYHEMYGLSESDMVADAKSTLQHLQRLEQAQTQERNDA